jgi:hypothetical protein
LFYEAAANEKKKKQLLLLAGLRTRTGVHLLLVVFVYAF